MPKHRAYPLVSILVCLVSAQACTYNTSGRGGPLQFGLKPARGVLLQQRCGSAPEYSKRLSRFARLRCTVIIHVTAAVAWMRISPLYCSSSSIRRHGHGPCTPGRPRTAGHSSATRKVLRFAVSVCVPPSSIEDNAYPVRVGSESAPSQR